VVTLIGFGSLWGVLTNRQDAVDRNRVEDRAQIQSCLSSAAALQVRVASVETEQVGTRRQIDSELAAVRRELERVARAFERLSEDGRALRAHR